jgi:hypothetical protein
MRCRVAVLGRVPPRAGTPELPALRSPEDSLAVVRTDQPVSSPTAAAVRSTPTKAAATRATLAPAAGGSNDESDEMPEAVEY